MSYLEIISRCAADPFFFLCCLSWVSMIIGASFWFGVHLARCAAAKLAALRQLLHRKPRP